MSTNNADWIPVFPLPSRSVLQSGGTVFAPPVVEPIPNADDQTIAVKWLPVFPQPPRPIVYAAGSDWPFQIFDPLHASPDLMGWQPTIVQASRPLPFRSGTSHVGPIPDPRSESVDRTIPIYQNPSRRVTPRAVPDAYAGPPVGSLVPGVDGWGPHVRQPARNVIRDKSQAFASGFSFDILVNPNIPVIPVGHGRNIVRNGLLPTSATPIVVEPMVLDPVSIQPSRAILHATGTVAVGPVSTAGQFPNVDKWAPTIVQPSRPLSMTSQTSQTFTEPLFFPAGPETVNFRPILIQPSRSIARNHGTESVLPPVQPKPEILWHAPPDVQPHRVVVRAEGTSFAEPVSLARETVLADKWAPHFVQPRRVVVRPEGTGFVSVSFYGGPQPDPRRGTSSPVGPDRYAGTATLVGPDPDRSSAVPTGPDPRRGTRIR